MGLHAAHLQSSPQVSLKQFTSRSAYLKSLFLSISLPLFPLPSPIPPPDFGCLLPFAFLPAVSSIKPIILPCQQSYHLSRPARSVTHPKMATINLPTNFGDLVRYMDSLSPEQRERVIKKYRPSAPRTPHDPRNLTQRSIMYVLRA